MKKHKLLTLTLLVISLARLHGQGEVTSYTPLRDGTVGILAILVVYSPEGQTGYSNKIEMYHADTAAMRKYIVAERAFQTAEADRYQTLSDEAQAKADSLYLALVDMNDGLGAVDGPEPLREPSQPGQDPARWGAILQDQEMQIEIG